MNDLKMKQHAAIQSTLQWQDAILENLKTIGDETQAAKEPLWVFVTGVDAEENLNLEQIKYVTGKNDTWYFKPGEEHWETLVETWIHLVGCIGQIGSIEPPDNLVVDTTNMVIAGWHPLYCPDDGPLPTLVMALENAKEHQEAFESPLVELMGALTDMDEEEDNIINLMNSYNLEAPTWPAHEEGECEY